MSLLGYASCCESVGTTPPVDDECNCTAANVGVGIEHYITGSTGPFEFRRTTGTGDVDCRIDAGDPLTNQVHHTANLATRTAFQTLIANPSRDVLTPGNLRLFLMAIEAGTNITIDNITADSFRINSPAPPPAAGAEVFQVDGTATKSTTSTVYQLVETLATDPRNQIKDGDEWKINMCIEVCHPVNVFTVNTFIRWQIETAAGVFTTFDEWQINAPITIGGGEPSIPFHRTKRLVVSFDDPRMRVQVRMSAAQASATFVERPRWGGVQIAPAP